MTTLTNYQHLTLKILIENTNSKNAITGVEIAKQIGLRNRVNGVQGGDFRSIIHALRVKGYPICANTRGYFYARTEEELSKFIMSMERRLLSQQEAIKGLTDSYHNIKSALPTDREGAPQKVGKVKLPVRVKSEDGTYHVKYQEFDIDSNGKPIIPPGVDIIK